MNNQSKTHRYTVDDPDQPTEIPTGQFVVKVQVPLVEGKGIFPTKEGKGSLLVYNKDRSLKGHLGRVKGQEELYDALEKEVRKNGFKGQKGFFPAICKKDSTEVNGFKLEINPEKMLPVETW